MCVSIYKFAIVASATELDSDSPESGLAEFYRLMSFEAESHSGKGIRRLFPDDAVVLMSSTAESIELIDADESMGHIQQKSEESGFEDFSILFISKNIRCQIADVTAYCVTFFKVQHSGLDV